MTRNLTSLLVVGMLLAGDAGRPRADEVAPIAGALAREVIGPRQTLAEAIDYCESAVPRTPAAESVADWEQQAGRIRSDAFNRVIFKGAAATWRDAKTRVEWLETIGGGPGYRIKKLRYEALPGLWIPALLYEPEALAGKVPVVLDLNGHDRNGKSADYKQVICINQAKRGMIALNPEWFGMGQFSDGNYRHDLINHLDLCGASGIAAHYLAMTRGIDLLLSLEHADPTRVAVTGLSGGGWQTIFVSAFDTRVTFADPVAGYSSLLTRTRHFSDLGDAEQTPCDLATVTDYAPMTALLAPRATLLTFNVKDDCCFASGHALPPLLEAARPIYKLYGREDRLRSHVNHDPGTHNYLLDNRQAFYRAVGDYFYPKDPSYRAEEVPSDAEIKDAKALDVSLPPENVSLHSLALDLSRRLPRDGGLPTDRDAAEAWRDDRRAKLRDVVRAKRAEARAEKVAESEQDGLASTFWRLKVGGWSVPVVELVRGKPSATAVVLRDSGRKDASAVVGRLLEGGHRVFAVDPFYVGEAKVIERDYLFALLLAAVGDRPLGLQAGQLAAVARWAKSAHEEAPLTIVAEGPRTSTMALVSAGLEDRAIDRVELSAPLGSLKELLETKAAYADSPELFCFGLLEQFDVAQLAALVAPRPLVVANPSERARKELRGLKGWYRTWGTEWEPLP